MRQIRAARSVPEWGFPERGVGILRKLGVALPLVCVALLAANAGANEPDSPGERLLAAAPPELVERLLDKKVVVLEEVDDEEKGSFVIAYALFEKSRDEVLALLTQPGRQREYRPELRSIETVESFEGGRVDEQKMKVMFKTLVYRLRYVRDPETDRIEWKLDPDFDNDLKRLEGFWEFYALDDARTLGRFGSAVDVGRAVPGFVQKRLTRKTVVKTVENCRRWIDSNGEWRP